MNVRYFCGPRLRQLLDNVQPLIFAKWGELPSVRPLAVQTDCPGLAFDFNMGMRLQIPEGNWHVKIFDGDSGTSFFDADVSDTLLVSLEKFFVNWTFMLWRDGELVFEHRFNPKGLYVYLLFQLSGMGDRIALFPYAEEFRKKWNCKISCSVEPYLRELFGLYYPNIEQKPIKNSYATYFPAPGFTPTFTPEELRKAPMEKIGQQIFGLSCAEKIIYRPTKPRQIKEPYVCIAAQASSTVKSWLNPYGWALVVDYLKKLGYRVLCIDRDREQTNHGFTVKMPDGAEDFTGNLPLVERVNLLAYADFFIGTASGLAWLAWAADCPVILISGITPAWYEFSTPYRVINRLVCFGCHNNLYVEWPKYSSCPFYKDTDRAYECSRKISARQVIQTIDRLIADKRTGRFSYPNFL